MNGNEPVANEVDAAGEARITGPDLFNQKSRAMTPKNLANPHIAYLSLGSNIHAAVNLPLSVRMLSELTHIAAVSQVWETPPVGTHGPNFLNVAVAIHTPMARTFLKSLVLRRVEVLMGRRRTANKYAPRPIDIDIVVFDGQVIDAKVWTEAFLAIPLAELIPDLLQGESHETLQGAAERLRQSVNLVPRPDVKLL